METVEKVGFTVYRGEFEKITKQNIAEIRLFKNALEVLMSYDYTFEVQEANPFGEPLPPTSLTDVCRLRVIMPREGLGICESITFHPYDVKRENPISMIVLERVGVKNDVLIRCKHEEAMRLYKILRKWILADKT